MKKIIGLFSFISTVFLTGCFTPTMENLPRQEPGKGVVTLYSTSLQPTAYFKYAINNQSSGYIEGAKVSTVYLTPGNYDFTVDAPYVNEPLHKSLNVQAGHYYFLNMYITTLRDRNLKTTYHFDLVPQEEAMKSLQGAKKFTGWNDLVMNTLNGKQFQ